MISLKKLILFACIGLLIGWCARVYYLYTNSEKATIQIINKGTKVPMGKDFFDMENNQANGYSVKVLKSQILSRNEFLKKYNQKQNALLPNVEYLYLVKVTFYNDGNSLGEGGGMNLMPFLLCGTNYALPIDSPSYFILNPKIPGLSFSLRQQTNMTVTIPFAVYTSSNSYQLIKSNVPKLLISEYPTEKLLKIK